MTTTSTRTTAASDVTARARLMSVGAALWAVSSVVWGISELEDQEFGTLAFVAVDVAWWVSMVLAPALLVVGHTALRAALGADLPKVGRIGIVVSATGLAAMGLGIGIEIASMTVGGGEVALGHAILLIGYLVAVVGAVLTGLTVIRRRRDGLSWTGGWLLVLALPLGIAVMFLGSLIAPETDAVFWAGLTLPMGISWALLGRSLSTDRPTVS